jgi:hypothetical protein
VDVIVRVVAGTADDVWSLRAWLVAEDEFRGCVQPVEQSPEPGALGPDLTGLLVDLAGPAAALAAVLVAWIRSRHGDVDLSVEGRNGTTVRVSARRVRGLDVDGLRAEIEQLGHAVEAKPGGPE